MTSKEQSRLFSPKFDNKETVIASSGTTVTFNFRDDGIDSADTFYYNLGAGGAKSFVLRPSATIIITHINGREMSDPITVTTAGWTDKFLEVSSLTIDTAADNTSIKLFARGGN